jgi:hypothetical protein
VNCCALIIAPKTERNERVAAGVALAVLRRALLTILFATPVAAADLPAADLPPAALVAHIARHPDEIPDIFRAFGNRLMAGDRELERYLAEFTREHAKRERDVRMLVSLQLVDPQRFLSEPEFRARVVPLLPKALDASVSEEIRRACLRELNEIGLSFDEAEQVGVGWGVVARESSGRRVAFGDQVRMPDDFSGPIEASIFSINSDFFTADEAKSFLSAVRKAAPKRRIVVIGDLPVAGVERIETFARPYTPWPRDPFTVGRGRDGGIVFVNRPNLQPEREEDANMVRALVQSLDAKWAVAPVPFHNGHVLLTPDAAWISIHTVEIRALELLGIERVPVETFGTKEGIERYTTAVRKAARELEDLYQRKIQFVHGLDSDPALFQKLGGGGGFDLDSLVTMLPQKDGKLVALVGDIALGAKLTVPKAYGVKGTVLPAKPLAAFLDTVASSLKARGIAVHRLPLMLVDASPKPFLVTFNNVVLEPGRAEGFASLIAAADAEVRKTFAKAGYELTLYPPLIRSVLLSGGYRCASNHVRPLAAYSMVNGSAKRDSSAD